MSYRVFTRNWWQDDGSGGLDPISPVPRGQTLRGCKRIKTEGEARKLAMEYNRTQNPGKYSHKAEYEEN
jgi:hypothetical protein